MSGWISFWTAVYAAMLSSFVILVIYIVPAGARDLIQLFRDLNKQGEEGEEE